MTVDDLIAAGYKKFHDATMAHEWKLGDWYQDSYQKRIVDDFGTQYFITIIHGVRNHPNYSYPFFSASNQFTKGGDKGLTFNIETLYQNESVEEIEKFFHDLWTNMNLDYYEGGVNGERVPQE